MTVWAGWQLPVNVRDQNRGTSGYRFGNWSDAGARSHNYNTPNSNSTLTLNLNAGPFVPILDIDNNGELSAATDGMLLLRYLLGFRDANLIGGNVIGANAERTSAAQIEAYLASILAANNGGALVFNVDGSGNNVLAMTDGLLVLRYMLGLTGTPLIDNACAASCNATTVKSALDALLP